MELQRRAPAQVVQSGADKFYNPKWKKILRAHAIKTVGMVGAATEGAVLLNTYEFFT